MIAALYVETGLEARLARRLVRNTTSGCLLWSGATNAKGYGTISITPGKPGYTHRIAWEMANGPIPSGLCVLHRCDTPACCEVGHLFLGTRADNNRDMRDKGRSRAGAANAAQTACKRGHPLSGENLRVYRGKRHCRACSALWARTKRAAK